MISSFYLARRCGLSSINSNEDVSYIHKNIFSHTNLSEVVVEVNVPGTQVSAEQCGVCGEDGRYR